MMLNKISFAGLVLALLGTVSRARAAAGRPAPVVEESTSTVSVSLIYTVEKLRDPFIKGGSSAGVSVVGPKEFSPEDFSIHNLSLKGLMKDAGTDYALLVDKEFGVSFVLRKGKLYDIRNKTVPGISGTIDIKAKQVSVMTGDKDVQILRLGEEEEPQ